MSENKSKTVSIFILIDALGWSYIKDRPFLDEIAKEKRAVKSELGFSSGVIPTILTGRHPVEHRHWSLFLRDEKNSPFKWARFLRFLPKKILNSRVGREIVEQISKRTFGYTGYFETYLIPVEFLPFFDISEHKSIYQPNGIRQGDSIFDYLSKNDVFYQSLFYPIKDEEIFNKCQESLSKKEYDFHFLYCAELDAFLHKACKDADAVNKEIDFYEKKIMDVYHEAKKNYSDVNIFVFADHGMAPVYEQYDLIPEVNALGFSMPKDFIAFYDSTMARFWFFSAEAEKAVRELLETKDFGHIMSEQEMRNEGVFFEDAMYGELVFLVNTGSVIVPSFMGNQAPEGMHGYSVHDDIMDAGFVSNVVSGVELNTVKDFYNLMRKYAEKN